MKIRGSIVFLLLVALIAVAISAGWRMAKSGVKQRADGHFRPVSRASQARPTAPEVSSEAPNISSATVATRPAAAAVAPAGDAVALPVAQAAKFIDRYADAPVLSRSESSTADGKILRVRIVKTDFKYPLLRIENVIAKDPQTGAETLTAQTAMVADHVLVKSKPGVEAADFQALLARAGATLRRRIPNSDLFIVEFPAPGPNTVPDAVKALGAEAKFIQYAEPDYIVATQVVPSDSLFSQLWGMHNTGQTGGTADADIDAPEAWEVATGNLAIRVGVIDTGIERTHPDLAANMWINPNEIAANNIDDDANGYIDDIRGRDFYNEDNDPTDDHGHGTHVAGTLGGSGNNGQGVTGVCWNVSLIGLKFLSSTGSGSTSDATEATLYATGIGVKLTSNSWGGGGYSQALKDAIDAADAAGILFVAAAGNSATDSDLSPQYPAAYTSANIIAVAATDHFDAKASFSNYGATTVDLAAPGVSILSCARGGGFATLSGTSMATPHVAGACALLWSRRPALTNRNIKDLLLGSVDQIPSMTRKALSDGRLNIRSALKSGVSVTPYGTQVSSSGFQGEPFTPTSRLYTLTNLGDSPVAWTAAISQPWLDLSSSSGTLAPAGTATVTVTLNAAVAALGVGSHAAAVTFTDAAAGVTLSRPFNLTVLNPLTFSPAVGFASRGEIGGPFAPAMAGYTLTNNGSSPFDWSASASQPWLEASPSGGTLAPGQNTLLVVQLTEAAEQLPQGLHNASLAIANETNGQTSAISVSLRVGPDRFTEIFDTTTNDTAYQTFTFTPGPVTSFYNVTRRLAAAFPTDPAGGTPLPLSDDSNIAVSLAGGASVSLYGTPYASFFVGSNGYITFGSGDSDVSESLADHFNRPRIAALFDDLDPAAGGSVSWKQLADRAVVTFQNVPEWATGGSNSFQIELLFDGTIRITVLGLTARDGLIGLSRGTGLPSPFLESDFSGYPRPPLLVTTLADENDGGLGSGTGDSLREAITAAGLIAGADMIHFTPSLGGGVIVLGGTPLAVNSDLTIDATGLPAKIGISGGQASRVFEIPAGRLVSITGLTVTGGRANAGPGGGISNAGALYLSHVTVAGNQTLDFEWLGSGGGIFNSGTLHLDKTTVSGNSVFFGDGGGIFNSGSLSLVNSTVSNNYVEDGVGGGISNAGNLTLLHATVSGNHVWFGVGGGVFTQTEILAVENSIIAGNSGHDFVSDEISGGITASSGANITSGDPRLAPLGDYGGGTETMPPLPGSPVIDAAVPGISTPPADQLGDARPRGPLPDLGAVEAFPFSSLALADSDGDLIDDRLEPAYHLTVGVNDSGVDSDGDSSSDAEELANMTDSLDANSFLKIISFTPAAGFDPATNPLFDITFTSFPGLSYSLECDRNLDFSSPQALVQPLGPAGGFSVSAQLGLLPGRDFVRVRRDP